MPKLPRQRNREQRLIIFKKKTIMSYFVTRKTSVRNSNQNFLNNNKLHELPETESFKVYKS